MLSGNEITITIVDKHIYGNVDILLNNIIARMSYIFEFISVVLYLCKNVEQGQFFLVFYVYKGR